MAVFRNFEVVGGHGPYLLVALVGYRACGAEREFGELRDAFTTCRDPSIVLDSDHPAVPVTAAPIDGFPKLGNATLAVRLSGYVNDHLVYVDFVFFRIGPVVAVTFVISFDPPDSERSKDVAPRQAARLASRLSG